MPAVCCRMTHGSRADGMLLQLLERERLLRARLLGVDDRALARDRHRFLHRRHAELRAHVGVEADRDLDAFLDDGLEAGELELHDVGSDVQAGNWNEPVSLVVATCGWSSDGPVRVTVDARQHRAGLVGDLPEDLAGLRLGPGRRRGQHERQRRQHGGNTHFHLYIPPVMTTTDELLERAGTNSRMSATDDRCPGPCDRWRDEMLTTWKERR